MERQMTTYVAHLNDKSLLELNGGEARSFLQNLISNDMNLVTPNNGLYAFLLSAQGKFLHDFFIAETSSNTFSLEVASERLLDLKRRLTMLKLRADVTIAERDDLNVYASWPIQNVAGSFEYKDQTLMDGRDTDLCSRTYSETPPDEPNASPDDLRTYLASKGVATSHHDFIVDKTTIMEAGLDGQYAVSWTKGCFVGQELTARMKYRGLVKRLLVPTQQTIPVETNLKIDGKSVGVMQSDRFALIKRDAIDFENSAVVTEAGGAVSFIKPDWWSRAEATSVKT